MIKCCLIKALFAHQRFVQDIYLVTCMCVAVILHIMGYMVIWRKPNDLLSTGSKRWAGDSHSGVIHHPLSLTECFYITSFHIIFYTHTHKARRLLTTSINKVVLNVSEQPGLPSLVQTTSHALWFMKKSRDHGQRLYKVCLLGQPNDPYKWCETGKQAYVCDCLGL